MARLAALVVATALLCAGCGSVEGERTTTKGVTISRADGSALVPHAAERRGSWSMMAFFDTGEPADEGAPLAQSLTAMSEPRTPADDLPDWATGMLDGIGQAPGYDPGRPLEAKSLRLIQAPGPDGYGIYAMPTTNGWVCMVGYQQPNGGGSAGCRHGLNDGVALDIGGDGEDAHVGGLRADDVTAVDVVVDGKAHPARLGRNAFLLELTMDELCQGSGLDQLVVHRDGGATATFALRSPLGPRGASSCG